MNVMIHNEIDNWSKSGFSIEVTIKQKKKLEILIKEIQNNLDIFKTDFYIMKNDNYPIWTKNTNTISIKFYIIDNYFIDLFNYLLTSFFNNTFSKDNNEMGIEYTVKKDIIYIKIWHNDILELTNESIKIIDEYKYNILNISHKIK